MLLVNNYEGYLLTKDKPVDGEENSDQFSIDKLSQLDGERKIIRGIFIDHSVANDDKHFYIIVSKEYDGFYEILNSKYSREKFSIKVKFRFEPGNRI